jgi:hypothetical protein
VTQYNDYTYTEAPAGAPATMISPTSGSTLGISSVQFEWTTGTEVIQYDLWLGLNGPGSSDLYTSGWVTSTSVTVPRLPGLGATIYARLYSDVDGVTHYNDYTYNEAVADTPAPQQQLYGHNFTGDANNCNQHATCAIDLGFKIRAGDTVTACFVPEGTTGFVIVSGITGETWTEAPIKNAPSVSITAWAANSPATAISSSAGTGTTFTTSAVTGTISVGQVAVGTNIPANDNVIGISGSFPNFTIALATATTGAVSGTVDFRSVTFTASNSFIAGEYVVLSGFTTTTAFNGERNQVIISATSTTFTVGNTESGSSTETGSAVLQNSQDFIEPGHWYGGTTCFYTLSATGGESSLTATFINQTPANITNMTFFVMDFKCLALCTPAFDSSQADLSYTVDNQCTANCAVPALPISGTNDVCIQIAEFGEAWASNSAPWDLIDSDPYGGNSEAIVMNSATCPVITWGQTSASPGNFATYAFSFAP